MLQLVMPQQFLKPVKFSSPRLKWSSQGLWRLWRRRRSKSWQPSFRQPKVTLAQSKEKAKGGASVVQADRNIGYHDPTVQDLGAKECGADMLNAATASALCVRAILHGITPIEVVPGGFTGVWKYLEEAPTVVEWMTRLAFHHRATIALGLGLTNFPEEFELDDVTSGYTLATTKILQMSWR